MLTKVEVIRTVAFDGKYCDSSCDFSQEDGGCLKYGAMLYLRVEGRPFRVYSERCDECLRDFPPPEEQTP